MYRYPVYSHKTCHRATQKPKQHNTKVGTVEFKKCVSRCCRQLQKLIGRGLSAERPPEMLNNKTQSVSLYDVSDGPSEAINIYTVPFIDFCVIQQLRYALVTESRRTAARR